jgi:23S rRNA (pseudouridine1915-N3)-methyltransferase
MKIVFLTIGKTINKHLIELQNDYQERLKHYIPFDYIAIPELKNNRNLTEAEQKEKEADLILKAFEPTDEIILLDENGKQYGSVDFSDFISKKIMGNQKRMVFVVGGPYGFSQRVYNRANGLISLSKMTFSHQMVRIIFAEQLYRAFTILRGEPYHHQ